MVELKQVYLQLLKINMIRTKDNNYYKQWSYLSESQENWYFVNNSWKKYINGKKKYNNIFINKIKTIYI